MRIEELPDAAREDNLDSPTLPLSTSPLALRSYRFTAITNFATLMAGVVSGAILSRCLGPEGRGAWALLILFPNLVGSLFSLAVPQAVTYFVSKGDFQRAELSGAAALLGALLGSLGAVCAIFLSPLLLTGDKVHLSGDLRLACLFAWPMVLTPHLESLALGLRLVSRYNLIRMSFACAQIVVLTALWSLNSLTPLSAVLGTLLLLAFQGATYFAITLPVSGFSVPSAALLLKVLRRGLAFFLPVVALTILYSSDRTVLMRLTTLSQLGLYSVALSITNPILHIGEAFTQLSFIEVSGESHRSQSIAIIACRFRQSQVIALGLGLLTATASPLVLPIAFGEAFAPALSTCFWLSIAMVFRSLSRSLENSIRATGVVWLGTSAACIATATVIASSLITVPRFGGTGFAMSLLLGHGLQLTSLILYAHKALQVPWPHLWGLRLAVFRQLIQGSNNNAQRGQDIVGVSHK